jgi:hypothetical protein
MILLFIGGGIITIPALLILAVVVCFLLKRNRNKRKELYLNKGGDKDVSR